MSTVWFFWTPFNSEKSVHVKEQSLLFDLFKAFDKIESSYKSDFKQFNKSIFLHACATCYELPSNIPYRGLAFKNNWKKIIAKQQTYTNSIIAKKKEEWAGFTLFLR